MDSLSKDLVHLLVIAAAFAVTVFGCRGAEPFHENMSVSGSGGSGGVISGSGGGFDAGPLTGTGGSPMSGSGGAGATAGTGGTGGMVMTGSGGSGGSPVPDAGSGGAGDARPNGGNGGGGGTADGAGGAVDAPPAAGCMRANWVFTGEECRAAIDGDPTGSHWTTGSAQGSMGPESVTLTFSTVVTIDGVTLITVLPNDGPAAYLVEYSMNGTTFMGFTPPSSGPGADNLVIVFPLTAMRAIRVTQTGMKNPSWWSIHDMTIANCHCWVQCPSDM
jgi:hypothetical protein